MYIIFSISIFYHLHLEFTNFSIYFYIQLQLFTNVYNRLVFCRHNLVDLFFNIRIIYFGIILIFQ